ncbi:hypothetical protein EOD39_10855 [Acipenser ruthenus]|uniref:DDE-1 domain-containing protein n=1 Tax=Acipenser ruthenus TaxID=7906 RepID=A0A662YSR2_ACIRT|nr:hypothetical protein EOD39_10855 [Acipenser ruthenus]
MLADLIKSLSKRGFPIRKSEIQTLEFQFAEANNIPGFSDQKKAAGHYCFEEFLTRNPSLGRRKPEALSAARAACFNQTVIKKWFADYEELLSNLGIKDVPSHIWNCDETGLQDHFISSKVVSEVGSPCFEVTATERGETTTALASFNAAGGYGPLLIIFKAKRLKTEWVFGAPDNTLVKVSDNGWINSDLFLGWGRKFDNLLPKDNERPHVLLLDGHSSHVFNMDFLTLMKQNNVYVVCYPPHTTHHMQQVDKPFFKSLEHNWNLEGRRLTWLTGGKKLLKAVLFSIFKKAWERTATVEITQARFRGTGMYPLNSNAIDPQCFTLSMTTERVLEPETPGQSTTTPEAATAQPAEIPTPSEVATEDVACATFQDLIPIPTRERPSTRRKRSKPPSFHLTSEDHFMYINSRAKPTNSKGKKGKVKTASVDTAQDTCHVCKVKYADEADPKSM